MSGAEVGRPRTVDPETRAPAARLVGSRIRAARTRAGLTQRELAKRLGVRQQQLSAWEVGRHVPRDARIDAISDVTGAPVEFLLGDERWDELVDPAPL